MSNPNHTRTPPDPVIVAEFGLAPESLRPVTTGHINATWLGRDKQQRPLVLQRVNRVFSALVNRDIDAVTRHLRAKGIATPVLVPAPGGALWLERAGAVWRTLSYIDGSTHEVVADPARAGEAGRVLAEFHLGLADLTHRFENVRLGVHDTARHLETLSETLGAQSKHPRFEEVAALAAEILLLAAELEPLPMAPDRIVHGDPKISNVMFDRRTDKALCLIDLDTLAEMPVALELGDALRSWCNPRAEDAAGAGLSSALFDAATAAYGRVARGWLEPAEWRAIPAATLTVAVELSARFCADALHERYFDWDRDRYASASEHNLARARGQLAVARAVRAALPDLQAIVARNFA